MPPAIIAAIIGAATTVGATIYNAKNQPSIPTSTSPSPADVTKNAIATETANREGATKAAAQVLPGLQYNTSGGLSPDAYQTLSADFSGNAGLANSPQMKQLIAQFLGLNTSDTFGGAGAPFGTGSTQSNLVSPGLTG